MNKTLKRLTAVLLAVIMVVSTSAFAFAKQDVTPVIVISGMNAYPLVDENGASQFPMEADVLLNDLPPVLASAVASIAKGNDWSYLSKYGMDAIVDLFAGIACDEKGDSVKNMHTTLFPESIDNYRDIIEAEDTNQEAVARAIGDKIGWDNVYFMHYDWRISPMKLADELDEYVKRAMEETGSSKVSLVPMSFGGTIANAYLYKYGCENIKNVVYASTAFNGVELVGQLFTGNPDITLVETMVYLAAFTQDIDILTELLQLVSTYMVNNEGIAEKYVDELISSFIDQLQDQAYTEVFGSSLAHMKGLWTLMPVAYYEEAKTYMKSLIDFSDDFFDEIDVYMHQIQENNKANIEKLQSNGVNVYITGAYGYSGIPVSPACVRRTDTLIETYLMTGNCTVAPYGETLNKSDLTTDGCKEHNHVSTDKVVDASACFLPEQTWVIANMGHLKYDYGTRACDLLVWLATSEEYVTVHTSSEYPQFMQMHKNTGMVTSLTQGITIENEKIEKQWYEYIVFFFKNILVFINKVFSFVYK